MLSKEPHQTATGPNALHTICATKPPEIINAYSKPFLDVHRSAMKLGRRNFVIPGHGAYMASLNRNLSRAMDGSLTARQALRIIVSEWELTTLEFGRDEQIKRWKDLAKD